MAKAKNPSLEIQFLLPPAASRRYETSPVIAWTGAQLLHWGKRIDHWQLAQNKLERLIKNTINALLVIFAIAGFVVAGWFLWLLQQNGTPPWQFYRLQSWQLLIFWLALLADTYLFYRIQTELEQFKKIPKRAYQLTPPRFQPITVDQAETLTAENVVDISQFFTAQALTAVEKAWALADQYNYRQVQPIHLLVGLLSFGQTNSVLSRLGVPFEKLKSRIRTTAARLEPKTQQPTILAPALLRALFQAYYLAWQLRQKKVDITELLEGLVMEENEVFEIFYDLNVDADKIKNVVAWLRIRQQLGENWRRFRSRAILKPKNNMDRAMTAIATPVLDAFSQDVTLLARAGYLAPCIGREKEIEEIFRVIHGGTRRGALLIGQSGVGKQTIIDGIAQMMVEETVPAFLQDKRLVSIEIPKLVSGVAPAVAQQRLLAILNEVARSGNIVLVIPNIHTMVGISTGGPGSLDLAGTLSQVITSRNLLTIASTSPEDYRRFIEDKSQLADTLESVIIREVSGNIAIQILQAKAGTIEYQQKVYFSYDAIARTVELSDRYLHDRYLPEKAIEILQEVAVQVASRQGKNALVTANDVAQIISGKTNIPLTEITQEESQQLLNLEDRIHQRIVDQKEAVKMVAASLRRARAEMREAVRPIVNLLFLGPTGVGKTELAKTVAAVYFGAEKNMIRIDMSEYQEKTSISRLLGAAPGYGDGAGYLTEAVRKNPFSLILFDEIEKAHPDILNILLQVMDDGRLTDSSGRQIDFTNTIIIGTSNAGTAFIQDQIKAGATVEAIKQQLLDQQLDQYFRPEFLNRFDGIVVFKPLSIEDVEAITALMLKKVSDNLEEKGITLEVTPQAVTELARAGFDPTLGARPLRRVIQDRVQDILANDLLAGKITRRDTVIIEPGITLNVRKGTQF